MTRPLNHLNAISRQYHKAWKLLEGLRESRGKNLPDWPNWCFMPLSGWYAIVSEKYDLDRLPVELMLDVSKLGAIGTWRYSQGIYRFDADTESAIAGTIPHGELPVDVLMRLPEWCVYVETHERTFNDDILHGFFAFLEFDTNTGRSELRLLLDCANGLVPQILHMGRWTVMEAINRQFEEARLQAAAQLGVVLPGEQELSKQVKKITEEISPLLSLLLYICSDEPDIENHEYPDEQPGVPRPKKTKRGWRLFPPSKPKIWTIGGGIGETLRRQNQSSIPTGKAVKAHIRRAHWHGYWAGPKAGDRQFRYKWLHPIIVNAD